jgi:L-amino acid N-acyltransferase YncA
MTSPALLIRPSTPADLPAITAIYADAVLHGTGTFELDPPDQAEMARRRDDVVGKGLPWLVAQARRSSPDGADGPVLGYAYANHFRPRLAYRFCLEDSIYLHPNARGQGVGKLLLIELLARCEAAGARQMLAVIGDAANAGSVGVHAALGFSHTGVLKASGWKFNRWLDVVLMQRSLGLGDSTPGAV